MLVSLETIDLVCECAGPGRGELVSAVWCVRVTGPNYDLHPTAHVLHREQELIDVARDKVAVIGTCGSKGCEGFTARIAQERPALQKPMNKAFVERTIATR